jgi:hypothetical protein
MPPPARTYVTLETGWREAIPFALDSPDTFNAAVDKMIASAWRFRINGT